MERINSCLFELDIFNEKLLWSTIFSLFVTYSLEDEGLSAKFRKLNFNIKD